MGYLELTAVYPPAHGKKIAKSPKNGDTRSETCELAKRRAARLRRYTRMATRCHRNLYPARPFNRGVALNLTGLRSLLAATPLT